MTTSMHKTTKAVFGKTRKDRTVTVQSVASALGVDFQVARRHLDKLVAAGNLAVTGKKETGKRGRPAKLYQRA